MKTVIKGKTISDILSSQLSQIEKEVVAELHSIANGYKTVSGDNYSGGFQDGLIFALLKINPNWSPVIGENKTDDDVLEIIRGKK